MDRNSFFARSTKTQDVTLDDGSIVKIRKLTQSQVETMQRKYRNEDKALEGLRFIVSQAVVLDSGVRMFEDSDTDKLADIDFGTVNAIATAIMAFSGLTVDAKNA